MITGRDIYEGYSTGVLQPPYNNLNKDERTGYQHIAKEVNEGIWQTKVDTLRNILGDTAGTKAKTYNPDTKVWTTVEQHKNTYNELYWVHYESEPDTTRLTDYAFENMAGILPDVGEPIWMKALKEKQS